MFGAAFAGCLNPSAILRGSSTTNDSTHVGGSNTSLMNMTMPDNRSGGYNAFGETNKTDMIGMHAHDYWNGRARVTLFSEQVTMAPNGNTSGTEQVVRPPAGNLVYEGTGQIEVTISNPQLHACDPNGDTLGGYYVCTDTLPDNTGQGFPRVAVPDPQPSASLHLFYLTAASDPNAWIDGGALKWGAPTIIKITDPRQTDMPHSTGSLWVFRFVSSDPKDTMLEFSASATIVRGPGDIPEWPSHPLFYAATHYRAVANALSGESSDGALFGTTTGKVVPIDPALLISEGTNTLIVFANVSSYSNTNPAFAPDHWYLYFHNASFTNWNITGLNNPNNTISHKSLKWVIHVDPNGMDTVYGSQSRWQFELRGVWQNCYGGCPQYDVKYTMTVIASDYALPTSSYDQTSRG
jgi:hypothetical protein